MSDPIALVGTTAPLRSGRRRAARTASSPRSVGATILLALLLAFFLVPVMYLVSVSLMGQDETGQGVLLPAEPRWSNYSDVVASSGLVGAIVNSLVVAVVGSAVTLFFALPAAWAIVRYRTGGSTLAGTIMSPWLLPPIVAVVPLFTLLRVTGLNGSLVGLTLVYALLNIPVAVWLLEGFIRRLPRELDEAATLDGAGPFRTLYAVIAPVLVPALIAIGIIVAILNYNEFLLAGFLVPGQDTQTLPVLLSLFYGDRTPHYGKIAAASLIGVVPVYAAAVIFQRWLVGGLTAGAVR